MKLIDIGLLREDSRTKIINLNDLEDQDGNIFELPPDPENNLVFDPRPSGEIYWWTFDIEIQDSVHLIVTCTNDDDNGWWDEYLFFRVYDRTKEGVPVAFDSSVPYEYWGLDEESAPCDTIVVKVHHAATTIINNAFYGCTMATKFISNALIEEIQFSAFKGCISIRSILFSQVLKKIGRMAFAGCSVIDVLIIPSTVTSIGAHAFGWCRNMRILKLPDDIDLDNVGDNIILCSDLLLDKVPANQTIKQWLKHRYDPYPLHKVCYNAHVTIDEIQHCIQTHPHAAYLTDDFHMTALHMITIVTCTSNLQQTVSHNQDQCATCLLGGTGHITACFDANMSAAFAPDDRGKTPLDYLLESCDGLDVHTTLVTSLCLHRSAS